MIPGEGTDGRCVVWHLCQQIFKDKFNQTRKWIIVYMPVIIVSIANTHICCHNHQSVVILATIARILGDQYSWAILSKMQNHEWWHNQCEINDIKKL